jgi:hypothetical protein
MQIFSRSLNKLPQIVGGAATVGLIGVTFLIWYYFSPWFTQSGIRRASLSRTRTASMPVSSAWTAGTVT